MLLGSIEKNIVKAANKQLTKDIKILVNTDVNKIKGILIDIKYELEMKKEGYITITFENAEPISIGQLIINELLK